MSPKHEVTMMATRFVITYIIGYLNIFNTLEYIFEIVISNTLWSGFSIIQQIDCLVKINILTLAPCIIMIYDFMSYDHVIFIIYTIFLITVSCD